MRILGVESSAKSASVCIWEDGRILCESFSNNGLTHSKTVLLMIEDMLQQSGISLDSIEKLAIANGPGSFTGLRIGAAVVKGLSWARDIPCVGVSTLEAMVYNAIALEGVVCCVMDARAGQVYNAVFKIENGEIYRMCEDRAIAISELDTELANEKEIILLGDGATLCSTKLTHRNIKLLPEHMRYQRAFGVCEAAADLDGVSSEELTLQYIRKPQAERERLAKLNKE